MLHIAICDDDATQLAIILHHAQDYFNQLQEPVTFRTFSNASDFIDALDQKMLCDIALLDIVMPGLLGTELAKEIKQKSPQTEILFLTTSDEYALEAFAVRAIDYLLKPFTKEQFANSMDLVRTQLGLRQKAKIAFRPLNETVRIIEAAQIVYAESNGHVLDVHLKNGESLEVRRSLQTLTEELDSLLPNQFVSPTRGFLINLVEIQRITPETIQIPGAQIPLGKRKYRQFQKTYFDFMFAAAGHNTTADIH